MKICYLNRESVNWQVRECQKTDDGGIYYCPKCKRNKNPDTICPIGEVLSKLTRKPV